MEKDSPQLQREIEDQGGALKVLYDIFIAPISHSIGDELVIVPEEISKSKEWLVLHVPF